MFLCKISEFEKRFYQRYISKMLNKVMNKHGIKNTVNDLTFSDIKHTVVIYLT